MKPKVRAAFAATAILLSASIPAQAISYSYDFSDNSAGWSLGPEWQIGSATASVGQISGNPDPALDHTPTADNGVAGVIIGGNASTLGLHNFYYLESPVVDLSGAVGNVTLQFYRWLNSDYTPYMQNVIDVFDGTQWVNIWATGGGPGVQDSSWVLQSFDITPYANSDARVRFGFNVGNSGVLIVSSWNIDDLAVFDEAGATPLPAALPLLAGGLGALGLLGWRRKKKAAALAA
jgi:hypothetical protein